MAITQEADVGRSISVIERVGASLDVIPGLSDSYEGLNGCPNSAHATVQKRGSSCQTIVVLDKSPLYTRLFVGFDVPLACGI